MSEIEYRKGVSALILNAKDELLLVNLESFQEKYFAVPGGGVESGETLEDAVYRELSEELGILPTHLKWEGKSDIPIKVIYKEIILSRDGKEYGGQERYFFGFRFIGNESDVRAMPGEVRKYAWVPIGELQDYLLFENQLEETVEKLKELFRVLLNQDGLRTF